MADKKAELGIRYVAGATIEDCYLVAEKGPLRTAVKVAKLLDAQVVASLKAKGASTEMLPDSSKPKTDQQVVLGKEPTQPSKMSLPAVGDKGDSLPDSSKPKVDQTHDVGVEDYQPSKLVSKFAQLANGSIMRLAKMWGSRITVKAENQSISEPAKTADEAAKDLGAYRSDTTGDTFASSGKGDLGSVTPGTGGEPPQGLRQDAATKKKADIFSGPTGVRAIEPVKAPEEGKTIELPPGGKGIVAREDKMGEGKPGGSIGKTEIGYWASIPTESLATGPSDQGQWARKVAALREELKSTKANAEKFKMKADLLEQQLGKERKAALERQKDGFIDAIMGVLTTKGGLKASVGEIQDLEEKGLRPEDARVKAMAMARDRKRANLGTFSLEALKDMAETVTGLAGSIATEAEENHELPTGENVPSAVFESEPSSVEQRLSDNWGPVSSQSDGGL